MNTLPRKSLPWAAATLALVIAALAVYFFAGPSGAGAAGSPSAVPVADARDISAGPADARVVLIEYSDFQCEYCAGYSALLAPLRAKYADRVRFVYRFFPLGVHEQSMPAAQAAYAAYLQGRFWEMHDLLFQTQQDWTEGNDPTLYFQALAENLGLDTGRFLGDLGAEDTRQFITSEAEAGKAAGVEHTPWFVLDGVVVSFRTAADFEALVDAELNKR